MTYAGLPKLALDVILCPKDGGRLVGHNQEAFIWSDDLKCLICGQTYKVSNGIVRFDGLIDDKLMHQEIKSRNSEAIKYDQRLNSRFLREILPTLKLIGDVSDQVVLEYGAGTGRLTERLAGSKLIVAVDFSIDSLEILSAKDSLSPLALVCADATTVKFTEQQFDLVVTTQLVEHIPTPELRIGFYQLVKKHLKPNGRLIMSVYHQDWRRRLAGASQEGQHKNGIFYHYFNKTELQAELAPIFSQVKIGYLDLVWPLVTRLKCPPKIEAILSNWGVRIPLFRLLAHLLVVSAKS